MKRNQEIIAEYWKKDKERKEIESRMVNYNSSNLHFVGEQIKNYIEKLGGTNLMTIAETINPPQITFELNNSKFTTECIYDWNWENVKMMIDNTIKR